MRKFLLELYAWPLRLIRPNSGLNRVAFNPLVERLCTGLPERIPAVAPGGFRIEVDPNGYNGRKLWLLGANDWKINRIVNALLDPGDVLLDIGANLGTVGMGALAHVGPQGSLHFFEPQPALATALETALRGVPNATVHSLALYDRDGEMRLQTKPGHTGQVRLAGDRRVEGPTVPLRETCAYVSPLVEGRHFGVKIDVEGAEPKILPGLLALKGLKFVLFEGAADRGELMDLFAEAGFSVFGLRRTFLAPSVAWVRDAAASRAFHDFVAVRATASPPPDPLGLTRLKALMRKTALGPLNDRRFATNV